MKPSTCHNSSLKIGVNEVFKALNEGVSIECILVREGFHSAALRDIFQLASRRGVKVQKLPPKAFRKKGATDTQGIIAQIGVFKYSSIEDIFLKCPEINSPAVVVALNQVEDPRNLGAVIRTAEAVGALGVIIPKHRSAGVTEWARHSACGAEELIPVVRVTNLTDTLEQFKSRGFWVVGLSESSPTLFYKKKYNDRMVVVAGGENAGLASRVKNSCDDLVSIPMLGKTPSLNLSVSVAVLLCEIMRQKNP